MGRPYETTVETRQTIMDMWLKGFTYVEIAHRFKTYRQKTRSIVLSSNPTFEQYKQHDENRRIRQMAMKLNPKPLTP
jgi:ABC-type bacteriocin/lantibiotic exporter with double-glycine peptidase domain